MQKMLNIGRWLFPLSFIMYIGLHLGKPDTGAAFVPAFLPFPYFWNYFTAACIFAFIVSALVGKLDKLAYALMAIYVLLMALLVHLPCAMGNEQVTAMMLENIEREKELELVNVFRNIMIIGVLLGFAAFVAKDSRGFPVK